MQWMLSKLGNRFDWSASFWRFAAHCIVSPAFFASVPNGSVVRRVGRVFTNYASFAIGAGIVYLTVLALRERAFLGAVAVAAAGVVHFATAMVRLQVYYTFVRDV